MNKYLLKATILLLFLFTMFNISAQSTSGGRSRGNVIVNHQLSINANIRARVVIRHQTDGSFTPVNGTTNMIATLAAGNYVVEVSAPGYNTQSRAVTLNQNSTLTFQMQASTARLNVTSNVNGALIQVSGTSNAQGNAPWRMDLPLGNYNVTVSAEGYETQTRSINLQRQENLHFNLKQSTATAQIIIPPESLNMKDVNARSMIQVYDNGVLMNGTVLTLRPGQHTIQIVSGGLMTQTTIIAEAGRTYTIKPILSLLVE